MTKKFLNLLTALVITVSLAGVLPTFSASAETSGDYEYTVLGDGTVEITKYKGSATELEIPGELDGKVITSIGEDAFWGCDSLTNVTIGNSITSIGDTAFWSCDSLKSVTIGNSVISIGENAFWSCKSLTDVTIGNGVISIGMGAFWFCGSLKIVTIGNGVTNIGDWAFKDCYSLTKINVDSNNKKFSSEDGVLFNYDKTELIQYPIGSPQTTYTIPNSVTRIGYESFRYCSLTSIIIPNSVKTIGLSAFSDCNSNLIIKCYKGSYAEKYAVLNNIKYEELICKHNYTSKIISFATCTTNGIKMFTCNICGDEYAETISATGHDYQNGVCILCGKKEPNDEQSSQDPTNNSQNSSINPSNSQTTYNPNGNCDKVYISATDDSMSGVTTNKDIYVPRNCTLTLSGTNTINGNLYIYGTVENLGTLTYTGTMYCLHYGSMLSAGSQYDYGYLYNRGSLKGKELVVNSSYLSISIPAITHKEVITYDKVDAMCTEDGQTSYQVCAACNTQISTPDVIPAMGHNYENGVCKSCGEKDPNYKQPTNQSSQNPTNSINNNSNSSSQNVTTAPTTVSIKSPVTKATQATAKSSDTKTTVPKPAKVKSVKLTAKKKKLNVSWKKVSGATGYEVMYAKNNKFKGKKTVKVKKNKITIKRLKSKKKYFVKVRAYKIVNGNKKYGKWSKTVKVKVK